jgi:hypothetical protein
MNLAEMRDTVKFTIGLQSIVGYDETAKIERELYAGALDLLARTKCVARCINLHTIAGTTTYKLDHLIMALVDVEDGSRPRNRRDQSSDYGFTLIRADLLRLDPTPDADGVTQVWAVLRPQKMAADTDSPGMEAFGAIPDEWQDAIVTYALWKCADYADDQSAQQGERYRMLYEGQDGRGGRLGQIRIAVNKRGTAKAPGRRVRLRGVASHSNWVG